MTSYPPEYFYFPSISITDEIFRFPEEFPISPEADLIRVDSPPPPPYPSRLAEWGSDEEHLPPTNVTQV